MGNEFELEAWLGEAYDDLTPEQFDRLAREADRIDNRYPDPDHGDVVDAALTAALQYMLGQTTLAEAGERLTALRAEEARASAAVQQIAAMAVDDGMSETEAARQGRIDRMTVRRAQGKK